MPKATCGNVSLRSSVFLRLRMVLCIMHRHIGSHRAKAEIFGVSGHILVELSLAVVS